MDSFPVSKENADRFALTDEIIASVCTSENEPSWTGNVTRAIVSLLHNKALNGITGNVAIDVNSNSKFARNNSRLQF